MRKGGCLSEDNSHEDGEEGRDLSDVREVELAGTERKIFRMTSATG